MLLSGYDVGDYVDCVFFFQAEDGIRDVLGSRGLGDVYKRQDETTRVSNPMELELQTSMSCHVGVGNRTQVLWKSSQCS